MEAQAGARSRRYLPLTSETRLLRVSHFHINRITIPLLTHHIHNIPPRTIKLIPSTMLALQPSPNTTTSPPLKTTTPNLLPCKIQHNGPIPTPRRYWSPSTTHTATSNNTPALQTNGVANSPPKTKTSYLRGRKLAGRTVRLPRGYTGLVLQKTDMLLPANRKVPTAEELRAMEEDEEDLNGGMGQEAEVEVKTLEPRARFEEFVVWGHESAPEEDDVYVRGVEEWVAFAEAVSEGCITVDCCVGCWS